MSETMIFLLILGGTHALLPGKKIMLEGNRTRFANWSLMEWKKAGYDQYWIMLYE